MGVTLSKTILQEWQIGRSRSETKRSCRFSSAMSLSRIGCRLNVACDMFVRI
jgi:hypothetical protein